MEVDGGSTDLSYPHLHRGNIVNKEYARKIPYRFSRKGTNLGQPPVADALSEVRSTEKEQSVHEGQLRLLRLRTWGEPLF